MNKIFKVIWSKSKQCYVVVSEMTKNTTGKKKIVVASILAGLAMSTIGTHVMAVSTIPFTDKPSSALANGSVQSATTNGVAIGNAAFSDSNQSIAIGFRSFASGTAQGGTIQPSVAVGAGAHAQGNNTVAIGTIAENRASYGVALGNASKVTSGSDYGIAVGYKAEVSAVHSMAIGENAGASATLAVALGANAKATGANSYASGYNSAATAGDAVAIGTSSQATGGDSIALGKNANASNGDSIAIGQDTVSDKINSVALGKTSKATGASATALGPQAKATGSTAVAIGLNSEANQSSAVAIGQSSLASGLNAIASGYKSAASGENAAAYGNTAKAVDKNSLALGANTQATVEGGVALGSGSIANTVVGAGYNPNTGRSNTYTPTISNAMTSTWAAVSIGDGTNTRQLTGLAAGSKDTDAVNVAQLKSMNLAFIADGSTKGDVNLTNSALNVVGDSTYITTNGNNQTLTISGKKQTITVTNGTASASAGMADANNVAQAINQANADQTISYKANGGTANTVKVSDGLNFKNGTTTVATVGANGQVSYDLNTTTQQSITDSSTAVNRTIALGGTTGATTAKKLASGDVKFNIKGQTGTSALITTSASGDDVTIAPTSKLTAAVTAAENAADKNLSNISTSGKTVIKDLAKGAAQDAVKVAGTSLATVSDNTVGGVKTYTVDVNTGNLVVAANGQVGAAGTTGASGATGSNGVATTQNVATAINDAVTKAKASTTQALADAEHKFDGDTGTTSVRKHGEVLSIKGGVTNAASLTTGNIGVVSDGAGTLNVQLAKVLSGLTSATFTTAGGNTTVINSDGLTITPSGAGASAISMTTAGINAGNKEIKGVATGTTADAAVNKAQMDAAITAAAQDAVTVTGTGLATVSDNTTGGVKTYTVDVNTGNLVVAANGQVGAAGTTGVSGTAGSNGVATTQNVATAINDAIAKSNANTAQALADAKHNFAGDDATVISRKHGEQLNIKGGASTTATDLTSGNIAVVGDTASGTLNIKMAKALTGLTSATFTDGSGNTQTVTGASSTITDGAGNTTAMTKGGLSTTDGTNTTTVAPAGVTATNGTNTVKLNGSGIDAGNTQIKNVGKATTDNAAVNKKQMDDAVKAATDATTALGNNTIALGSDASSTTAKKLSTNAITFNIKGDTGANALITTSATGDDVTIAPTAKLTAAVTAAEKSADKDLSNITSAGKTVIKDLAVASAQDAVNVTGTGLATVSDNTTGGVKTYTVNVDEGKLVLDDTTGKIGANGATQGTTAGKNGVATTQNVATAINDAVTKAKASTTQALADAEHKFDGDTGATSIRKHGEVLSIKGGVINTADLATGNIGVVSDGAGTLNIRLAKVLSGLTSATFTTAGGNTTVINGDGVTITPSGAGASAISMTTDGINAGGKEVKGIADGTAADSAVSKGQMETAIANAQTAATSTEKVVAKTLSGDTNLATVTGQTGTAKGETYEVAVSENAVKNVAKAAAQDAVTVTGTGLATVSSNTAGGVKTYTVNVDEGKLVLDDTTGKIGANGATQGTTAGKNGVATTQNVATAINDAVTKAKASTAQALADAEHKFDGDTGTTSVRKHGEVLSIKGGVTTPADLATGNIGVISDGAGTLNIRLAKVLTGLTSATFTDGSGNTQTVTGASSTITDGAGHTTAMTKGGLSTTDGTNTTTVAPAGVTATDGTNTVKLNGSGIDAGNTQIKNVGKATTDDAAVNKKQMDDAVKAATDATTALGNNTIALGGDTGSTTAKKLSTNAITFNIKGDTGANALITTSATGDNVTIAPTAKLTDAVTAAEKSADKDLSNISTAGKTVIKDLAVTSAQDAVNVTGTGLATVSSNTAGGVKTYTVDVKAGNLVVDANGQVGTNGATGTGGAVGTDGVATTQNVATAINDAITKSNANTAQALADAEHKFDGDTGATSVRKHGEVLSIKGGVTTPADLSTGNIGVVSDGAGTLNIRLAKVLSGLTSATYTDGSGNTQVITGGSSTITDGAGNTTTMTKGGFSTTDGTNTTTVAPSGVTATNGTNTVKLNGSGIDAGNTQIKNVGKATTDDAAVNKKQMDDAVKAASDATTALGNNTITLGSNNGSTDAKKLNTSGGIQFNINGESGPNALITTTASGNTVSIASTTKLTNAVAAAENAANKDLSNLSANGESRIKDLAKSAASWNVQTNDGATTAVSGGDTVNFVDGKNITITNTGREIKVATKDEVSFNKVTVGGITLDNDGIDAGNKEIKNVATGTTPNSAVNKQQLENALAGVSNINYTTSSTTDRAGSTPVRSVALSTGFDFKGDGNIQITEDAVNNGVIHYAMNPNLSGITSITGAGNGAPTMTFTSQNGNTPANVSINSNLDMGGHRITGVGPAEKPTDAVNKQQVDQALRGLTGMADNAARQYASKAGANAAALAALKPIQYDPLEPTQIMAGVGNYKSQTAVAVGMAHYTNENTMFNIGVSLDSHDNMVNAGVTHKFGYSPEKKAIPDRYKGGPISSIYVMQDEMQALLAKDQEKDAVISKQASEIDTLRQQNEEMQRKIDMILAKLQ